MNILFFLTPKSEVIYVNEEDTVGQAMDTMEKYKYSAVPIITKAGRYAGTLTEGDLLWGLKNKTDLVQKGLDNFRLPEMSAAVCFLLSADTGGQVGFLAPAGKMPHFPKQDAPNQHKVFPADRLAVRYLCSDCQKCLPPGMT